MNEQATTQPLQAVVFDWAGTMIDFGSCAPMGVFVRLFERLGIALTVAQARGPMGLPKWEHIQALGRLEDIARQWQRVHGRDFSDADVDALYEEFTPMNAQSVIDHATLIPGALDTVKALRSRGLKVGSTTGYNREIMKVVLPLAARQGYEPDNLVCAGDLALGRPTPMMMYRCLIDLGVWPAHAVVKVDDTAPGIAEGRAAGTWTVGLAISGNEVGLSLAEWQALPAQEQAALRAHATAVLRDAGADLVVDSVADLMPAIDQLAQKVLSGQRPRGL